MLLHEEDDQQSPVSVFDFQFRENEEHLSTFDRSLANVESMITFTFHFLLHNI